MENWISASGVQTSNSNGKMVVKYTKYLTWRKIRARASEPQLSPELLTVPSNYNSKEIDSAVLIVHILEYYTSSRVDEISDHNQASGYYILYEQEAH